MDFKEYQKKAWETAIYPNKGKNFIYPALGLGGESGEVLEKIKKILRDEKSLLTEEKKEELLNEMGDVLWYLAALSTELNLNLDDIAKKNLEKLKSRKERGKLHGSGDKR
ncbi:MAG: hypothetical protein KatS3mg001_279 [Candidatus Pacearchaeota archaeon]|nr:MAG: hypothetical protein KatS3mg001_279 [Candidatus Pacearchaeota archaeon]